MNIIEIGILGPLKIKFGKTEAKLNGAKLRHIFAILALRADEGVARDELIDELNLMDITEDAINSLHAHITRLRRWLRKHDQDPNLIETYNSCYRLNVDRESVDAHRFKTLTEQAISLAPETPLIVSQILDDALSLWRGVALADALDGELGSSGADELTGWRGIAQEMLLNAWISSGKSHMALANAKKFIADNPLNEVIYVRYMHALCEAGRYAEAMDVYREAEQILHTELRVKPGAELREAAAMVVSYRSWHQPQIRQDRSLKAHSAVIFDRSRASWA